MQDQETQSHGPVETTGDNAASVAQTVEQSQDSNPHHGTPESADPPEREQSLQERMKEQGQKGVRDKGAEKSKGGDDGKEEAEKKDAPGDQGQTPKFEPNFKYKAFGKEKELDPFWRDLVKDPESEKKVKEVFTRADAFDDMKQRYESASQEFQRVSQTHQDLDRDVKRVMHFRNSGDLDNFFASVQLTKQDVFQWAARQMELENLSPDQQAQYQQGVQARAQNIYNQQNYENIQQQFAEQRKQMVELQLDHSLQRPEYTSAASNWDQKMGDGAFRKLVIETAASHAQMTGQVWTPEEAIQNVVGRFGRLLESPQPQATAQAQTAPQTYSQQQSPQAQAPVMVQGKPVIPNIKGRGTSPVKQAPKSLDQLRKMAREAQFTEANTVYEG